MGSTVTHALAGSIPSMQRTAGSRLPGPALPEPRGVPTVTSIRLDESRAPVIAVVATPNVPVEVIASGPTIVHVVPAPAPMPAPTGAPMAVGAQLGSLVEADAAQRLGAVLARNGPTRLVALGIAGLGLLASVGALGAWPSVGSFAALWLVPGIVAFVGGLLVAARARPGLRAHPLENAALTVAAAEGGVVRAPRLALATGRPLHECEACLDALARAGHALVDADELGLVYRIAVARGAR